MYRSIFRPDLFAEQVFIITGGGSGIGRAVAHELASLGGRIMLGGRNEENLARVTAEITQAGGTAAYTLCNIRDEAQCAHLVQTTLATYGRLDGLFNNAGGQFPSPAELISRKGWHAVVETNLTGAFTMCQQAYNQWMNQHGGAIVNMVAEMWRGFPGMAHTGAARAAVVNLTMSLAVEWAKSGVRVNAIAPGTIEGSGLTKYDESVRPFIEMVKQDMPYGRLGTESEISAAVTFLFSPAASYISGETLKVDGASSLWRKTWHIEPHDNAPRPFEGWDEEE